MYKQCRPTQSKLSQNLSRNMSVDYGRFVLSVAYQSSIWGPLYTVERFGWMKLPDKSESKCFWRGDRSKGSMRRYSDLATCGAHHIIGHGIMLSFDQVKARPRFQPIMEVTNPAKGRNPTRPASWTARKVRITEEIEEAVFQLECVHIRAAQVWTAGFCSYSDHMSLRMLVTWGWLSYFVVVRFYIFFSRVGKAILRPTSRICKITKDVCAMCLQHAFSVAEAMSRANPVAFCFSDWHSNRSWRVYISWPVTPESSLTLVMCSGSGPRTDSRGTTGWFGIVFPKSNRKTLAELKAWIQANNCRELAVYVAQHHSS